MAMSVGRLLPQSELIVVTTPQSAAAEVSVRAGMMAVHTKQRVLGVVENMSAFACPHCGNLRISSATVAALWWPRC